MTPTAIAIGLGGLLTLSLIWRAGARRGRRAAETAATRVVSLFGRVLLMTAGMVGVQWLVVTHTSDLTLRIIVLALPDAIAAFVLTKALMVTDLGRRR